MASPLAASAQQPVSMSVVGFSMANCPGRQAGVYVGRGCESLISRQDARARYRENRAAAASLRASRGRTRPFIGVQRSSRPAFEVGTSRRSDGTRRTASSVGLKSA
jgi:hypothetical protein